MKSQFFLSFSHANITECAADICGKKQYCSRSKELALMRLFLEKENIPLPDSPLKVVQAVMNKLQVKTEQEIYKDSYFRWFFGESRANSIAREIFKPTGPNNSTALLNNHNIDETLDSWAKNAQEFGKESIYHVKYQMIDFADTGELGKLDLVEIGKNYDALVVVLNTDVSSGYGKHWFCIYIDFNNDPVTVEYFNSSGNSPMFEVQLWADKAVYKHRKSGVPADFLKIVNGTRLQKSKTECGVWCLMYILSRLHNKSHTWMIDSNVTDDDIIQYRKHLFR